MVLVVGNFPDTNVNPSEVALVVGAAVVFADPDNEVNKGVAVVLTGLNELRFSPVLAELADAVEKVDGNLPPRVNPPTIVVF